MRALRFKILDLRFIAAVLCALLLTACEKPMDEPQRDEALVLKSMQDSVACNIRMGDMPAMQLTWTAGTNHGTSSALYYTIDMNLADSAIADGLHFEIGRTMDRTFSLTHRQMVDSILPLFPIVEDDVPVRFAARVRAKVQMTGEEQVSQIIPLNVVRYAADTTHLYLIGSAMPTGWDRDHAAELQMDNSTLAGYTWTGKMRKGEFKVLATREDWYPAYLRDESVADSSAMIYCEKIGDYPDSKWEVDTTGNYAISLDTKARTIEIRYLGGEVYNHIYMIGDAAPGGWSWDNLTQMQHPESDLFIYEGMLNAGEIKFPVEIKSDFSGEMLFAPEPNCAPSLNGTFDIHTGDPDNKWIIPAAGKWRITINIKKTTISFIQL